MPKYNPDRIAALAAGSLGPAEAAALEKEIAADPRAAAELAAHRLALAALHRAPTPVLSAEERSELRRAVAAALNLEEAPVSAASSSRRRVPWRPLAVAAAALAVIAAAVPLVGLLSIGDDQAAVTVGDAANMSARSAEEDGQESLPGAQDGTGDPAVLGAERTFAAENAIEDLLADPASLIASADADLSTCRAEADDLLGEENDPTAAALDREAGELLVWFVSVDGATVQSLAVFDPADCSLLASHP